MEFCYNCGRFIKGNEEKSPRCSRFIDDNGSFVEVSVCGVCDFFERKRSLSEVRYREDGFGFLAHACAEYYNDGFFCDGLITLKRFRDIFLFASEEGKEFFAECCTIAPMIIDKINNGDKKDLYFGYIREELIKCIKLITRNQNEKAFSEYKIMINDLKTDLKLK